MLAVSQGSLPEAVEGIKTRLQSVADDLGLLTERIGLLDIVTVQELQSLGRRVAELEELSARAGQAPESLDERIGRIEARVKAWDAARRTKAARSARRIEGFTLGLWGAGAALFALAMVIFGGSAVSSDTATVRAVGVGLAGIAGWSLWQTALGALSSAARLWPSLGLGEPR